MAILTNEDRADKGARLVSLVHVDVDEETRVSDALSYIRHYCDREGIDWWDVVERANRSYEGDAEDGPYAQCLYDPCERCGDPARPDHVCIRDGSAPRP